MTFLSRIIVLRSPKSLLYYFMKAPTLDGNPGSATAPNRELSCRAPIPLRENLGALGLGFRGLRSRNSDTARRGSWFAVGLQAADLSQVQMHSATQVEATQYPNSDPPKWVPSLSRNARTLRIS